MIADGNDISGPIKKNNRPDNNPMAGTPYGAFLKRFFKNFLPNAYINNPTQTPAKSRGKMP